jgi:hypothetical protein
MNLTTLGIDLAKTSFSFVGITKSFRFNKQGFLLVTLQCFYEFLATQIFE